MLVSPRRMTYARLMAHDARIALLADVYARMAHGAYSLTVCTALSVTVHSWTAYSLTARVPRLMARARLHLIAARMPRLTACVLPR